MGGLLYKDFVTVCRIKKTNLVWLLVIATILYAILRISFPGNFGGTTFQGINDAGETVSILDSFFGALLGVYIVFFMCMVNSIICKIIEGDDKNKIRLYLSGMPINRNTYIASKYIFVGISCYVLLSVAYIWGIVCYEYCEPGIFRDYCEMIMSFLLSVACLCIFIAAIELPLFLLSGKERATLVKTSFLALIVFVMIGFLLFGDITWFKENTLLSIMLTWFEEHNTEMVIFQTLSPVMTLGLYYLSYRFTCKFTARKEL